MLCVSLDGRGAWGTIGTCLCIAESLHCSSETITTLLIGYTPIQNVFSVKKKKNEIQGSKIPEAEIGDGITKNLKPG